MRPLRPLRRELAFQLRHNSTTLGLWLGLALLVSGASALVLWRNHWQQIRQDQAAQLETQLGLLELRVNQHRTTVLDWGHWDTMAEFATGKDRDFVERELKPSSIISDGQVLLAVDSRGRLLTLQNAAGHSLSQALIDCLEERLEQLKALTPAATADAAFGLVCRLDAEVVIGAGTGIRPSSGVLPEKGWLIHASTLERPSYNSALNAAFRGINASLVLLRRQPRPEAVPVTGISELLSPGEQFVLKPSLRPAATAARAAEMTLPAWLALNLLLTAAFPVGLLVARQQRLSRRIRAWQDLRADRKLRHQISQMLLNRRQLLMSLHADPEALDGSWITAVRLLDPGTTPAPEPERTRARERSLHDLVVCLRDALQPRLMGLLDPGTILLAFTPPASRTPESIRILARLLDGPDAGPDGDRERWRTRCLVAPLQPGDQVEQVLSLSRALDSHVPAEPVMFLGSGATAMPATAERRGSRADDGALTGLPDGLVLEQPVIEVTVDQQRILYRQLLPDPAALAAVSHDATARIRSGDPALDHYMVRQVIDRLQRASDPQDGDRYGIVLSAASLAHSDRFHRLLQALEQLSGEQRRRLVVGLTETDLIGQADHGTPQVRALQELGAWVAIEEFGSGHFPIQPLFALQPDVLKLSSTYTQQLHDENIDSTVDFLLSYCRYNRCIFVLKGVDQRQQLQHWQRLGATVFQGSLFELGPARSR